MGEGRVIQTPRELMAAADALSGINPSMTSAEIQARMVSMTRESLEATYLCAEYKKTKDGDRRAEIRTRLEALVSKKPGLEVPDLATILRGVSMTAGQKGGRPKKHQDDKARKREAARAYRERQRKERAA